MPRLNGGSNYDSLKVDKMRIGKGGKGENEWEYIIEDLR